MRTTFRTSILLAALFGMAAGPALAQTGVGLGTLTPDASAALDISSASKGVLFPRVALTGPTDAATVANPAAGLVVYNTSATVGARAQLVANTGTTSAPVWAPLGASNYWSLKGNAATTAATNFLGTTDSVALSFRVNNIQRMQLQPGGALWVGDGIANQLIGDHAGYNYVPVGFLGSTAPGNNQFIGSYAGYNSTFAAYSQHIGVEAGYNASGNNNQYVGYQANYGGGRSGSFNGSNNQIFGYQAGYTNGGSNNQFLGYQSGYNNVGGRDNQYIGYQAGYSSVGYDGVFQNMPTNQFIGFQAGYSTKMGNQNSFVGYQAGYANVDGGANVFFGYKAGLQNISGQGNVYIGLLAGYTNTTGQGNVFVGNQAGFNATGSGNIAIGVQASTGTYSSSVAIGTGATVGANNVIVLGATGSNTTPSKVGIGVAAPSEALQVAGNILASGTITQNSDRRLKTNVRSLSGALAGVGQLRGVRYTFLPGKGPEGEQIGVIAQEVEKVYPELVRTDKATGLKSVNYAQLTPVLLEAIKELRTQVEAQQALLDASAAHQQQLEHQQGQTTASLETMQQQLTLLQASLMPTVVLDARAKK